MSHLFQLTPPIQRATRTIDAINRDIQSISTHAPYTEGDQPSTVPPIWQMAFQLTPPIQRATYLALVVVPVVVISTHAPYTEGDKRIF